MSASRETIYAALFALSAGITWTPPAGVGQFVTRSRRIKLFNEVPADQRPSIMQAEHDEQIDQRSALPYKRIFNASWFIYIAAGRDTTAVPADDLNLILNAVEAALAPALADVGYPSRNTLGGLVHHCYIAGTIFKDPGDLDGDGLLIIPFKILAP